MSVLYTAPVLWEGSQKHYRFHSSSIPYQELLDLSTLSSEYAGRQLYKGVHTRGNPAGPSLWPLDIKMRQPANSAVVCWAGKILALHERDLSYVLDAAHNTTSRGSSTLSVWNGAYPLSSSRGIQVVTICLLLFMFCHSVHSC